MSRLASLPVELQTLICTYLCEHCHPTAAWPPDRDASAALLALTRSCRRLRDVAQPFLYHIVQPVRLVPLVLTIIARPDLAGLVRWFDNHDALVDDISDADLKTLESAAAKVGIQLPEDWLNKIPEVQDRRGDPIEIDIHCVRTNYLTDILLSHLKQLDALSFDQFRFFQVGKLLDETTGKALGSVKRLSMASWDTQNGLNLECARSLLELMPQLENLAVSLCNRVPARLPLRSVKSIEFRRSKLSARHVQFAVHRCAKLESFSYESSSSLTCNYQELAMALVPDVLDEHKQTLRHLELQKQSADLPLWGNARGSLVKFMCVEVFMVSLPWLRCVEDNGGRGKRLMLSIPRNVRVLVFIGPYEDWRGLAMTLYHAIRARFFQMLSRVLVDVAGSALEDVTETLDEVGISCCQYAPNIHTLETLQPPLDPRLDD